MSDSNTIGVEQNNKTPERTNMTGDRNKDFLAFVVIILLAVIWVLTNSTVLTCTMIMILMVKTVQLINLSAATNDNANNISPPPQVCVKRSSTISSDIFSDRRSSLDNLTTSNTRESEDECSRDSVDYGKDAAEPNSDSSSLANEVQHLSESDAEQIDKLIRKKGTAAVLITSRADATGGTENSAEPSTVSEVSSDVSRSTEATKCKSAFVTENVMKIAVSYSGKERKRVLKITRILKDHMHASTNPDAVFFDKDFQHEICRLDGLSHLKSIYRRAQLVVVFLSPSYNDSRYCRGEWREIADRFLADTKNREATQLLLIKLGEYDMKKLDLVNNDFSVEGLRMSNEEIADTIFRRWEIIEENLKTD